MSILSAPRPSSTPITSLDPWTDRPVYDVPKAALVFGARIRHKVIGGTWKIVREAERLDSTRRFTIRVREQADNGSLFGPVLHWRLDEVAGLVTDEPAAPVESPNRDDVTLRPEPPAPDADKPLVVAMAIGINGTHYSVSPLAPSPDAVKAFRFVKIDGDGRAYDVEELEGGARCDCADFVFRREGLDTLGCKHVRAAWMCGLIAEYATTPPPRDAYSAHREKLATIAAAEDEVRRAAYDDAREAEALSARDAFEDIAESEAAARQVEPVPCCEPAEISPCSACVNVHTLPDDLSGDDWGDGFRWEPGPDPDPETDPEVLELIEAGAELEAEGEGPLADATPECFEAVAQGRADWMREFGLVPFVDWVSKDNRDDLLAEGAILDGWACYRDKEFEDARRARTSAMLAAEDALIAARELPTRTLAEQVDDHARELRSIGSPLHDLLAERAASLAAQIRLVEATTVEQFRDRLEAMLDAARDAAESRLQSGCC